MTTVRRTYKSLTGFQTFTEGITSACTLVTNSSYLATHELQKVEDAQDYRVFRKQMRNKE